MVVALGQQYNIVEKPTVILYTYFINRHAGTPEEQRKQKHCSTSSNMVVVIIYCYIVCEDEITTLTRGQRGSCSSDVDIFNIIQKVKNFVIHLAVDEEQWEITQGSKRQAGRTGFLAQYLSGLRHTGAPHT